MRERRPYHAGSMLGPAPGQDLSDQAQAEWITRISAYWNRSNAKAVDVARGLLTFLGPDGALMPAQETLSEAVKCSVKTVGRWIKAFVDVGFIRSILRRDLFGQTSNAYVILFPSEAQEPAQMPVQEQLSFYNAEKDSNAEASMDSLSSAGRPAALRRLNRWLGTVVQAVRPAPQPSRFTPGQQIALLLLQDHLALE